MYTHYHTVTLFVNTPMKRLDPFFNLDAVYYYFQFCSIGHFSVVVMSYAGFVNYVVRKQKM